MTGYILLAILTMGFSGIVAQTLLVRELLIIFSGNELSIGVILANWLVLEGAGSLLVGRCIEKADRKLEIFVLAQLAFALALPLAVYLARSFGGVAPGEGLGLVEILYLSFLILLPVSVPHGALFTFGCAIYSETRRGAGGTSPPEPEQARTAGTVYVYETIGTIVGGLVFVYLMLPHLHSVRIALLATWLNLVLCIVLLWPCRRGLLRGVVGAITGLLVVLSAALVCGSGADRLHRRSIAEQFQGQNVRDYQNSTYGNVAVVESEGQYTFFTDGIPTITTPVPDTVFVEEFAHLPMLFLERPESILVLSGGAGGVVNELLKHPTVQRIDYAELDPLLLQMARKYPTALTEGELSDPRVSVEHVDGRLFVRGAERRYDLILIGVSTPSDLQVNRVLTEEFFRLAKAQLRPGGLLALTLPGSLTYLGFELKDLNSTIFNTLEDVYAHLRVIPGDANLFLATDSGETSRADAQLLVERFNTRSLVTSLVTSGHIEYKLEETRRDWLLGALDRDAETNRDFSPVAVFHALGHRNRLFSPALQWWFENAKKIGLTHIAVLLVAFAALCAPLAAKRARSPRPAVVFAILCTGISGMLFDLILVFGFQIFCGYVFQQIALLVTAIMVGTAAGSLLMVRLVRRVESAWRLFVKMELLIIVFCAALPAMFAFLHPLFANPALSWLVHVCFMALCLGSGWLIGAQFPLAAAIYSGRSRSVTSTAGVLYASDLFGGCIGGILGGAALLPILGLTKTCLALVMVKICSLVILLVSPREVPAG